MATIKQLKFIKAICDELSIDEPKEDITTREASKFISKHVSKFYTKKAKDNEGSLQVSGGNNLKSESLFKPTERTNRISSKQNVKNMKALLRNAFGYDIWTNGKH